MNSREKLKIFIALPIDYQKAFIGDKVEEQLSSFAIVQKNDTQHPLPEEKLSRYIKDADAVIVGWGDNGLSENNIKNAKKLRIIGVIGASVKKVQPELAFEKGITIVNTAKIIGSCVAEHTLALMLCWIRRIIQFDGGMKKGAFSDKPWDDIATTRTWDAGSFLTGQNIGIVGMGIIGKRLVELLQPFQVKIRVYSTHFSPREAMHLNVELTSLDDVLKFSKIVSIHAGLREDTVHLIGERELSLMHEGALLINTARGRIVDEEALISVLQKGKIYAALDVYSEEPLPKDNPLRRLENVILTPHTAGPHLGGYNKEVRQKVGLSIAKDFELFFAGKTPPSALKRERVETMT